MIREEKLTKIAQERALEKLESYSVTKEGLKLALKNSFIAGANWEKENDIDIKDIGVPNICFSLIDIDDKKYDEYSKQRVERGFDDSETWSLSGTLANFLLPRLKRFNEVDMCLREDEYKEDMNNFISLLELEIRDDGIRDFTEEENKTIEKGLDAFKRLFFRLWW